MKRNIQSPGNKKKKEKAWRMHKRFVMYAMSFNSSLQPLML